MYGLYWFDSPERTNEDGSPKIPVLLDSFEEFPLGVAYRVQIAQLLQRVFVYGLKWPIRYMECAYIASLVMAIKNPKYDLPGGGLLFIQKIIVP